MFLIVISHVGAPTLYAQIYTPIFLSVFFFSSGYTWSRTVSFLDFVKKKGRALLIPFLCLGLINTILASVVEGDPFIDRYVNFLISRLGKWDDLWFISCLMSMHLIMYLLMHLLSSRKIILCISFVVSLAAYLLHLEYGITLPWQFENACIQLPFMALGLYYRGIEDKLDHLQNKVLVLISVMIYLFSSVTFISPRANVHLEFLGNWLVFMVIASFGTIVYVNFTKYICNRPYLKHRRIHRYFILCGQLTLVMYAFQSKVIRMIDLAGFKEVIPDWIYCLIAGALAYCIVSIPAYLIDRYFPWILGKRRFIQR